MARNALRLLALLPFATVACLTPDDRPPAGSLLITVSPSDAVMDGVSTEDGWTLSFSRAIASLGRVGFGGRHARWESCDVYSVARYTRVFNLLQGGPQKLSEQFALGHCELSFTLASPGPDALLGVGVTEADKTAMRTPGSDAWVPSGGISIMVEGAGVRSGASVGFRWVFRQDIRYEDCKVMVDGQEVRGADFASNQAQTFDIRMDVERLFRDDLKESAKLRFDPFAAADADHDALVTLEELAQVTLETLRMIGPYGLDGGGSMLGEGDGGEWPDVTMPDVEIPDAEGTEAGPGKVATLADYVYVALLPTVPRFRGAGSCTATPESPEGGGMH